MTRRIRDPSELAAALAIQRRAIFASCQGFDAGDRWEALRIATAVCVLVHDGGKNNRSILAQIALKGSMKFLASGAPVNPDNLFSCTPLVSIRLSGEHGALYIPNLDRRPVNHRMVSFEEWWERDLIFRSADNANRIIRKKLARALRNLEGGSHFEPVILDPNYIQLTRNDEWIAFHPPGRKYPVREIELASMRQMAWELSESLSRAGL